MDTQRVVKSQTLVCTLGHAGKGFYCYNVTLECNTLDRKIHSLIHHLFSITHTLSEEFIPSPSLARAFFLTQRDVDVHVCVCVHMCM